jgi:hypothetical protein
VELDHAHSLMAVAERVLGDGSVLRQVLELPDHLDAPGIEVAVARADQACRTAAETLSLLRLCLDDVLGTPGLEPVD